MNQSTKYDQYLKARCILNDQVLELPRAMAPPHVSNTNYTETQRVDAEGVELMHPMKRVDTEGVEPLLITNVIVPMVYSHQPNDIVGFMVR
jgi:hypothetical protein